MNQQPLTQAQTKTLISTMRNVATTLELFDFSEEDIESYKEYLALYGLESESIDSKEAIIEYLRQVTLDLEVEYVKAFNELP